MPSPVTTPVLAADIILVGAGKMGSALLEGWLGLGVDELRWLAPVRPELTAYHRYTPAEFIDAIRPAARSILAAEAPGKGG